MLFLITLVLFGDALISILALFNDYKIGQLGLYVETLILLMFAVLIWLKVWAGRLLKSGLNIF